MNLKTLEVVKPAFLQDESVLPGHRDASALLPLITAPSEKTPGDAETA